MKSKPFTPKETIRIVREADARKAIIRIWNERNLPSTEKGKGAASPLGGDAPFSARVAA